MPPPALPAPPTPTPTHTHTHITHTSKSLSALQVINYWQEENKHSLDEARAQFPHARFTGS